MEQSFVRLSVKDIKINEENPRYISKMMMESLKKSLSTSSKLLELSPLLLNEQNIILGGNMRFRALKELGVEEVPCIIIKGLTKEKQDELIIKDNLNYGDWDWNVLLDEWSPESLSEFGLNVPKVIVDETNNRELDTSRLETAFETWLNNDVLQLKLYYDSDTYDVVLSYFETSGEDNNYSVIRNLVDKYFVKNNLIKDRR